MLIIRFEIAFPCCTYFSVWGRFILTDSFFLMPFLCLGRKDKAMKTKMTLRQLRTLLPSTKGVPTPSKNWFREHPSEIFCSEQIGNARLTIYQNGFCTYSKRNHFCIFRVDGFNGIEYDRDKLFTDTEDIPEEMILDKPFLGTLAYIGDMQWDDNENRREENKRELLIDGDEEQWRGLKEFSEPCFLETLEEKEHEFEENVQLYAMIKKLSCKQQEVIFLYYFKHLTQKAIANQLNIDQSRVSRRLESAIKKLHNNIKL